MRTSGKKVQQGKEKIQVEPQPQDLHKTWFNLTLGENKWHWLLSHPGLLVELAKASLLEGPTQESRLPEQALFWFKGAPVLNTSSHQKHWEERIL